MNVKHNYHDHCWHVRGYAVLSLSLRLRTAVAILIVRHLLSHLGKAVVPKCPHALLEVGTATLTSAGDAWLRKGFAIQVEQLLGQYKSTVESGTRDRLFEIIKERAVQWRADLESERRKASEATLLVSYLQTLATTTRNPLAALAAFANIVDRLNEVSRAARIALQDSLPREHQLEIQIAADLQKLKERENRYSEFRLRQQQPEVPSPPAGSRLRIKVWRAPIISGVVVLLLVLMLGYPLLTASVPALFVTLLLRLVRGRTKAPGFLTDAAPAKEEASEFGMAGRIPERLAQKLLAYGGAIEETAVLAGEARAAEELLGMLEQSAWASHASAIGRTLDEIEVQLQRDWAAIPDGPYHEGDPGSVELLGRDLATTMVSRWLECEGTSTIVDRVLSAFERSQSDSLLQAMVKGDGTVLVRELLASAQGAYGNLNFEDVLTLICERPAEQGLFVHWLETLVETACAASNLRRDVRLDSALSVARLTVGLPGGNADPLAALIAQRFSKATVVLSSIPDAIEIVFDLRNVPAEALLTHALTREHYDSANSWERDQLWHFPPRAGSNGKSTILLQGSKIVARLEQEGGRRGNEPSNEIIFPGDLQIEVLTDIAGNGRRER